MLNKVSKVAKLDHLRSSMFSSENNIAIFILIFDSLRHSRIQLFH